MKLQEFSKLGLRLRELSRRMGAGSNTVKRFLNDEKAVSLKIEHNKALKGAACAWCNSYAIQN